MIGVSFQQTYKYERGTNRSSSGRLCRIAQALGVDAGYFFDGMGGDEMFRPIQEQRLLLELRATSWPSRIAGSVSLVRAPPEPEGEELSPNAQPARSRSASPRLSVGLLTSAKPAAAKMLRQPTWSSR